MASRSDYVKYIADVHANKQGFALCGRRIDHEWVFAGIEMVRTPIM